MMGTSTSTNTKRCLQDWQGAAEGHEHEHPVIRHAPAAKECVRFVHLEALRPLAVPWPRCQDLPGEPYELQSQDLLVAVSHAWPYQAHPDPLGTKSGAVFDLAEQAARANKEEGHTLIFYDFLSISQQPFLPSQAPRTEKEHDQFLAALQVMHKIYMYADVVVHVEVEWAPVPGDGEEICVPLAELHGAQFRQVGTEVQVKAAPAGQLRPVVSSYDTIVDLDGVPVSHVHEVEAAIRCMRQHDLVRVRKAPFGRQNRTPAGARGWIFLERFLSMVKVALASEAEVDKVVFSNSEATMQQILEGGRRLRAAAHAGTPKLQELLQEFLAELKVKHFSGTSSDALAGQAASQAPKGRLWVWDSDEKIVARLMQEAVAVLPLRWAEEVALIEHATAFGHQRNSARMRLAQEITDGQCVIYETDQGLMRTVSTAALRLTRSDGRILVQLAQWVSGSWQWNVKLPSTKIREGEAPSDAIKRVLQEELAPFASGAAIGAPEVSINWKPSAKYTVSTKYIVNVFAATLRDAFVPPDILKPEMLEEAAARYKPVMVLADARKTFLYAWMEWQEYDALNGGRADVEVLRLVFRDLRLKEEDVERARKLWSDAPDA